jgi:hypothetical protein
MKFALIAAASVLAFAATPSFAGGFSGSNYAGSPQFANSAAVNYAHQTGAIKAVVNKGHINQETGAAAEAINEGNCGCVGKRVAKASSKNTSFQTATISAFSNKGSINQSSVSTSLARNSTWH